MERPCRGSPASCLSCLIDHGFKPKLFLSINSSTYPPSFPSTGTSMPTAARRCGEDEGQCSLSADRRSWSPVPRQRKGREILSRGGEWQCSLSADRKVSSPACRQRGNVTFPDSGDEGRCSIVGDKSF
eukprot:1158743-Pelagomonas_calceolata.AAC.23